MYVYVFVFHNRRPEKLTFPPPAAPGLGRFAQNAGLNSDVLNLAFCVKRPSRGPADEQNVSFFPGDVCVDTCMYVYVFVFHSRRPEKAYVPSASCPGTWTLCTKREIKRGIEIQDGHIT